MTSARQYDRLAALYDPMDLAEFLFKRHIRDRIFEGLQGLVLDAGVGTGCNIPYYPVGATVVGADASPGMLAQAHRRSRETAMDIRLAAQDVTRLGFADGAFDAIVATFLFGVIGDALQPAALAELARVCKPGGEIRIVDYTLARSRVRRVLMQTFWAPYQTVVMKCSFASRPERHMASAGLTLVREEFIYSDFVRMLVAEPADASTR